MGRDFKGRISDVEVMQRKDWLFEYVRRKIIKSYK